MLYANVRVSAQTTHDYGEKSWEGARFALTNALEYGSCAAEVGRGLGLLSEQSCLEFVEKARKTVTAQPLLDDAWQHLEVIARGSAHP